VPTVKTTNSGGSSDTINERKEKRIREVTSRN